MAKQRIVIVGGGIAGASLVEALCAQAGREAFKIDVFERETSGAYDRFELPRLLRRQTTAQELVRYDRDWFHERGVTLHAGMQARYIDRPRRQVHADGLNLPYDKLVLATGSSPYLPSIRNLLLGDGRLHPGVFTFRTLQDCDAVGAALGGARRVALLGGGPLGLAIAHAIAERGVPAHVFHLGAHLMSGQLDPGAAKILKIKLEGLGVMLHFGKRAQAVVGDGTLRGLAFSDGSNFECDAVVIATGFQPDIWLGFQCELSVERAIVVDGHMRSPDDPNIYALGECAQWRSAIHGRPEQIAEQARVIADQLCERYSEERYRGQRLAASYQVAGLALTTMGRPEDTDADDVAQSSEPLRDRYKKLVLRRGRLISAILVGDLRQAESLTRLFQSSAPLSPEAQASLFDLSLPAQAALSPADAIDPPSTPLATEPKLS